jgi:hypothetical protein
MRKAQAAAGQSYRRASTSFAERDVCSANADGGGDAAFAEVQVNAGEELDRTTTTQSGERPKGWPRVPRGVRHEMPNNAEAHIWLGCVCSRSDINRQ